MVFEGPPIRSHEVCIITVDFQISGQLETIGPPFSFINDRGRQSFLVHDARLTPLTPNSRLRSIVHPRLTLRKHQVALLYFTSPETRASIRPLVRRELLVAYTPVAVCRGYFHMSAEASLHEFLDVTPGDLLPVAEARIFPLINLPAPFPSEADIILVGRDYVQFYHPA